MALCVDEYVLRLQIPIGNAFDVMQEVENENYFSSVEPRGILIEFLCSSEVCKDFAARAIVEL